VGAVTDEFEKKAGLYLMKDQGRALIGVGDNGVRKVLGIPKNSKFGDIDGMAPDFLSVTKSGGLALSEVKGGTAVIVQDAIDQLTNAVHKLKELNLAGDIDRVEIIMKKGEGFDIWVWGTKDGYLFNKHTSKTVAIEGFPLLFIKVVEI
jgi:hypothetical protein